MYTTSNPTRHESSHSRLIPHSIPTIIQKIQRPQMPIYPHIRTRPLILQYKCSNFIPLDGIYMESLIRIPVVSHLEIDVAREHAVDAADAVVVAESDALCKHAC